MKYYVERIERITLNGMAVKAVKIFEEYEHHREFAGMFYVPEKIANKNILAYLKVEGEIL
jgi:hypothetical protein